MFFLPLGLKSQIDTNQKPSNSIAGLTMVYHSAAHVTAVICFCQD